MRDHSNDDAFLECDTCKVHESRGRMSIYRCGNQIWIVAEDIYYFMEVPYCPFCVKGAEAL